MSSNNLPVSPPAFNRPPRLQLEALPLETIELPTPPNVTENSEQGWLLTLIPLLGIGSMALFYALLNTNGRGGLFAVPLLLLGIITVAGTLAANRARRKEAQRRREKDVIQYVRQLDRKRARLQAAHDVQRTILQHNFPTPDSLYDIALNHSTRLWERRPEDSDFTTLRIGSGRIESQIPVQAPDPDADNPLLRRALTIADRYRMLEDAPITVALRDQVSVALTGNRTALLATLRAMIVHAATLHTPSDLRLYVLAPSTHYEDWRWLMWLPHCDGQPQSTLAFDAMQIRNLLGSISQLVDERLKQGEVAAAQLPHLMVIVDGIGLANHEPVFTTMLGEGGQINLSVVCIASSYEEIPRACQGLLQITSNQRAHYRDFNGVEIADFTPDRLEAHDAEQIARALARVAIHDPQESGRIPRVVNFLELYDARDLQALREALMHNWARPVSHGVLPYPVTIGRESLAADMQLWLDEEHHGPHGVLAGTTGSGKSELLQTLICALAIEHHPLLLNFLLIDFKGGSSFNTFAKLPHTVGVVTNLDRARVERTLIALRSEVEGRQQFLERLALRDITQYHRQSTHSIQQLLAPEYQPMPHLFIIVDEFAQLAKEMPDFMTALVRIAQLGRSLGLHLLLGTQSPMDIITDEMNDNLQFRICLRVQNIEASRAMLRRPDAAYLPTGWPGRGYFQVGERGVFKEFQTAYVGGDGVLAEGQREGTPTLSLIDDGAAIDLLQTAPQAVAQRPRSAARPLSALISDLIIDYAAYSGIAQASPLLLPPLPELLDFNALRSPEMRGWDGENWQTGGSDTNGEIIRVGSAPIGLMDDVQQRRQRPQYVHLNSGHWERGDRKDGHVLIIGAPGSGKTTTLKTLALSLALLHHPNRLHLYLLSFTGGGLNELGALPHAEQVIHGIETERVRRLFRRLTRLLDERQSGHNSTSQPVVILLLDQFEQLRDSYYEQHMGDFERIIHEGRGGGIFVAFTASSINAVPERLRALVQQRIVLQLNSSSDYALAVGAVKHGEHQALPPGRGYSTGSPPLLCQIAYLPENDLSSTLKGLQAAYRNAHSHEISDGDPPEQAPTPIRELPTQISFNMLPLAALDAQDDILTTLGRSDDDALSPFILRWTDAGQHFLVTGPPGSGKTNLLLTAVLAACSTYAPSEIRVVVVDFGGRGLRGLQALKHVVAYVTDPQALEQQLEYVRTERQKRNTQSNREASPFPRVVIVIDDYDATSEALGFDSPLLRLLRDEVRLHDFVGLHLWIAGYFERNADPLIKHLLMRRSGFAFGGRDHLYTLNVRLPNLPSELLPRGRAYFAHYSSIVTVQTAWVENALLTANRINAQVWADAPPAQWSHESENTLKPTQHSVNTRTMLDIDTAGLIHDLLSRRGETDT